MVQAVGHYASLRIIAETIELSRTEIVRTATASITSTHHILLGNLAVTSTDSANFIEEALAEKDELTKPLAQELLQYGAHDGKSAGTASLGNRMKMFKKKVAKEERELAALWEEWTEVQRLITEVGVEILGSQAVEALATRATGTLGGFEITESTKIAQEIEANKQRLRQEIESMTAGLIERMHASEKVLLAELLMTWIALMSVHRYRKWTYVRRSNVRSS